MIIGSKCAIHPCFVGFSDLPGMQETGTDFLRHGSGVRWREKQPLIALATRGLMHHRPGYPLSGCVPAEPNSVSPSITKIPHLDYSSTINPLPLGKTGLANAAPEHSPFLLGAVATGHGQISSPPLSMFRAIGIEAAEARKVVHGTAPPMRS